MIKSSLTLNRRKELKLIVELPAKKSDKRRDEIGQKKREERIR